MGAVMMDEWSGFKYPYFVTIRCSNFSCVCATINAADLNIVMANPWNDLNSFKSNRQNYNVGSSGIGYEGDSFNTAHSKTSISSIAGPS